VNVGSALLAACACALASPWFARAPVSATLPSAASVRWPTQFEGRPLRPVPLTARERVFLEGFPGAVARFTDGERDIVMRWVTQPTRRLHPASDCYRGVGYSVATPRIVADASGVQWRCFVATRAGERRDVCESLRDREAGRWTDVSAWYWAAALEHSQGPWLVTTVAARLE